MARSFFFIPWCAEPLRAFHYRVRSFDDLTNVPFTVFPFRKVV